MLYLPLQQRVEMMPTMRSNPTGGRPDYSLHQLMAGQQGPPGEGAALAGGTAAAGHSPVKP